MSQKKVEEYKKYKANRKAILEKEKKMKKVKKVVAIVGTVAVLCGFGYWGVYSYQDLHREEVNFMNLLNQDEGGFFDPILEQ